MLPMLARRAAQAVERRLENGDDDAVHELCERYYLGVIDADEVIGELLSTWHHDAENKD